MWSIARLSDDFAVWPSRLLPFIAVEWSRVARSWA
jgi:hypothetical protein